MRKILVTETYNSDLFVEQLINVVTFFPERCKLGLFVVVIFRVFLDDYVVKISCLCEVLYVFLKNHLFHL